MLCGSLIRGTWRLLSEARFGTMTSLPNFWASLPHFLGADTCGRSSSFRRGLLNGHLPRAWPPELHSQSVRALTSGLPVNHELHVANLNLPHLDHDVLPSSVMRTRNQAVERRMFLCGICIFHDLAHRQCPKLKAWWRWCVWCLWK